MKRKAGVRDIKGSTLRNETPDCRCCGLPYGQFLATGRLGCPYCYASFRERLENLFLTKYGRKNHPAPEKRKAAARKSAKLPFRSEALRQELLLAVAREDFERAALLRDILKQRGLD